MKRKIRKYQVWQAYPHAELEFKALPVQEHKYCFWMETPFSGSLTYTLGLQTLLASIAKSFDEPCKILSSGIFHY